MNSAVKDPALRGGPFMDFGSNRVEDVRELRDRTLCERAHLIELSQAIEKLDATLRDNAKGYCLEQLYAQVPDCLQGYVELVYDLNNQPSFRLVQPLLYKSSHYDLSSLQSIILSDISGDDRPFVLSTPRLGNAELIELKLAHLKVTNTTNCSVQNIRVRRSQIFVKHLT